MSNALKSAASMVHICVICEGQTEGYFVQKLLVPYFSNLNIWIRPTLLRTNNHQQGGGNVTISRLGLHIRNEYEYADYITTLVDFYGFVDNQDRTRQELETAITEEAARRIGKKFHAEKLIPYIQMYEFEGLLFSDIEKFNIHDHWSPRAAQALKRIYNAFDTPEEINNSPVTAPSKRLNKIFPGYSRNKTLYGPMIAEEIGLAKIRQECPQFNQWITELENLHPHV